MSTPARGSAGSSLREHGALGVRRTARSGERKGATFHHRHTLFAALVLALDTGLLACDDRPDLPESAGEDVPTPDTVVLDRRAPAPDRLRDLHESAERTEIIDGVAHYRFDVRLGPGDFDIVRLHRVVRELPSAGAAPSDRAVNTAGAVFLTHGASLTFDAIFLKAGTLDPDEETSLAVFLAANDIDVWGMDFGWTRVPLETSDFSFMRDWGAERDVDHVLAAMSIARWIRAATGQGRGRMHLLGYSYGGGIAYAAAGRETQQRRLRRDIRGIVPVDMALKYAGPDQVAQFAPCAAFERAERRLRDGQYHGRLGVRFGAISNLAITAPDDRAPAPEDSPLQGLTNYQAALFAGTNTFEREPGEFWHFVGGDLNEDGDPVGLLYTDPDRWLRLGASLPPYMPVRGRYEMAGAGCSEAEDVSIDDHLAEIRVPILYLGAEGGFGSGGHFTTSLTGSDDITLHTVSLKPAEQRTIDFGHADLLLGDEAGDLAWSVLRDWLVEPGRR